MTKQKSNDKVATARQLFINRPYMPDMALKAAAKRAQIQPELVSVTSRVPEIRRP